MEREDWMHVGMVAGGAVLGLAARCFLKSKAMKKVAVSTTAVALRVQKCAEKGAASLESQADDIVAQAREENRKREERDTAYGKAGKDDLISVDDQA
jgi:hypothetical protein